MAITIKPAPKLGWPSEELAEAMIWTAYGDTIDYDDSSVDIFVLPSGAEIVGIGVRIGTAFTAAGLGGIGARIVDSDANVLLSLGATLTDSNQVPFTFCFESVPSSDRPDGITISWDAPGTSDCSAGAVTPILLYRLNGGSQKWVTGDWR